MTREGPPGIAGPLIGAAPAAHTTAELSVPGASSTHSAHRVRTCSAIAGA
jgi:hypothetical protein